MAYTLQDLLNDPILPSYTLLTKPQRLGDVVITSASVQELPQDNFMQAHELILTTAAGSDTDPHVFQELIENACAVQAAAILLALPHAAAPMPPSVLDYANRYGLPIIQIPWEVRFVSIQTHVLEGIQEQKLSRYLAIQNTLLNAYFNQASLNDAATKIAFHFRCPIIISSLDGDDLQVPSDSLLPEDCEPIVWDIAINDITTGTLKVYDNGPNRDLLLQDRDHIQKYIVFPLSLWYNRKMVENLTEMRIKNDFVWNLATKNYTSFDEMIRQGQSLQVDLLRPYVCLVLQVALADTGHSFSHTVAEKMPEIETQVLQKAKKQHLRLFIGSMTPQLIVYVENEGNKTADALPSFVTATQQLLQEKYPMFTFHWGISEITRDQTTFHTLYTNAALAAQYAIEQATDTYYFSYGETRKALIVSILSKEEDIKKTAAETLGALLDYDKTSRAELLTTLATYIQMNYSISKTATALHIHRQSLLYRLGKIEELTGMSLHNHDDMFVLEISSRIYKSY